MSCVLAKMLHILILCPVLLIGGVQTLTIDSQLGTSIEDCFERISIGEQLPSSAIYRNVTELTTRECEQICKQDKQCQTYDYGVGAKGNATCDLSITSEKEVRENKVLVRHPDYDVYARRLQCEQLPPRPMTPLADEIDELTGNDRPHHRPVFRPDVDDRPLTGDYIVSGDIDPYNLGSKPQSYRPDDISQRPVFDVGPSYGDHKPQDLSYPERPRPGRPQDSFRPDPFRPNDQYRPEPNRPTDSYRPNRPQSDQYQKPKPENDVLHFGYEKPINKPDPYMPERPNYNYIIRPNRKPRPEYTSSRPNDIYKPEKPSYNYNSQYASNYGQNTQNDNSVYVEIYDPPRPYVPIKDRPIQHNHDLGFLGYGTYSSQNSYTHNSGYTGSITEIDKPLKPYEKPIRPNQYGQNDQYGFDQRPNRRPNDKYKPGNYNSYGNQEYSQGQSSYGENRPYQDQGPQKPSYNKPSYNDDKVGYGNQGYGQSSYGSSQSSYGGQSSYDSFQGGSYQGSQGSQSYGSSHGGNQASYEGNQGSYGGNQGSYGSQGSYSSSGYGNRPVFDYETHKPGYGNENPTYNHQKPGYGSMKPDYDSPKPGYGQKPDYNNPKPGYGTQKPDYDNPNPGYGQKPDYDNLNPGYGSQRPDYDRPKPGYGSSKPDYDQKPGYGSQKPDYDSPKPGYGHTPVYDSPKPGYGQKPDYDNHDPGYGGQRPDYNTPKPGYGSSKPDYDQKPEYGSHKPGHGSQKPGYGQTPEYDRPKPGYGQKPDYDNPGYGSQRPDYNPKPEYGSQKPGSGNQKPGYGNERPDPDYERPYQKPGYGNEKPDDTGYGSGLVKPVYEYEIDKPTNVPTYISRPGGDIVTSRPFIIQDYERPGYKQPGSAFTACFRRVLAGRRALRSFVSKVVPCERLEDCRRECALEKRFHCESFNYRLDQSFRGKGLCELMTKPIEAFDQHRDFVDDKNYDFYEIDRNSLEPNCPETLHGPGSLHSGFLSSKPDRIDHTDLRPNRVDLRPNRVDVRPNGVDVRPNRVDQSGWRDRNDWVGGYRNSFDNRRIYEDRRQGNQRYEEHYVPYQIGQARTEDSSWGQYGGNYGGQYYKDRNDHHKSISYWGLNRPLNFRKSHEFDYHSLGKNLDISLSNNDFHHIQTDKGTGYGHGSWKRGRWSVSGAESREGNEDITGNNDKGTGYGHGSWKRGRWSVSGADGNLESREGNEEGIRGNNECFARRKPGMSLKSGAIRRALLTQNVVECETACFSEREFKCVSYSYRYSSSRGTDNCFLSERPYRGLEMSSDTASDVYAMPQDKCVTSTKPWVESECFWHVRSDTSVLGAAVKATLKAAGLGACEAECIRAVGFFCRGFSYRFASPSDEDTHNCILTSSPTTTLSRSDASGHELYARGNYGRGCEPAVYDETQNGGNCPEEKCYLQYDKAARLTGAAIRGQARVKDEQTCGIACTEAPFRCLSFSYNNNALQTSDNCLLSEIRLFDLQRGVDYVHSEDDWLFAFDLFNSKCWRKLHGEEHTSELPHPIQPEHGHFTSPEASGPEYLPDSPELPYIPESGPSGPSGPTGPIGPYGPSYEIDPPDKTYPIQPFKPSRPERPSFRPEPEIYRPGFRPPESKNPNFQPPEIIIPFKPEYPDPEPRPIYGPDPRPFRPEVSGYKPEPSGYKPEPSGYRPEPTGYLPEVSGYRPGVSGHRPESSGSRPERPFRPEIYPKPDLGFQPDVKPGYIPGQRPQKPVNQGDRENGPMEASWRHYTVSGFPCRAGTKCAQNVVVGHWACEPEGGEIGSWDYCCAPTHRCGYSEGFHKPWCYVGHKQDQWRPCSEKYYPYHHHSTPHPSQGNRDPPSRPHRPFRDTPNSPWPVKATPPSPDYTPHWDKPPGPYLSEADKNYWDRLYEDGPMAYYDKHGNPLPGYSRVPTENRPYIRYKHNNGPPSSGHWVPVADGPQPVPGLGAPRYWPVAYLHRGPPPNITYFRYNEKPTNERQDNTTNQSRDGPESRDDDNGLILEDDRSNDRNGHSNGNNNDRRNNDDSGRRNDDPRRNNDDPRRRNDDSRRNNDDPRRRNDDSRQNNDDSGRNYDYRDNDDDYRRNNDENRRNDDNSRRNNGPRRNNNSRGNGNSYRGNDDSRRKDNRRNDDSRNNNDDYNDPRNYNDSREDNYTDNSRNNDDSRRNDNFNNTSIEPNAKRDETIRDDKKIDDNKDGTFNNVDKPTKTTEAPNVKANNSDVVLVKPEDFKTKDSLKGIHDKLDDFSKSIEVLNIEDAKVDKLSDLKTLEAEERQIEEIGRLLANRRGTQIVLEKRSQKDLEAKSIAIDKDLDFNFGNKFPIERRGVIKRISKDELDRDRNDKSLEVSETTFVRPPRVLSTTDNIRKAVVNGKIFYDATLKDNRDIFTNTRKPKNLRRNENTTPSVINNNNFGKKKIIRTRNTNPVRRVKRVYRKRYNPEEVRRRLLERDRSKNSTGKSL